MEIRARMDEDSQKHSCGLVLSVRLPDYTSQESLVTNLPTLLAFILPCLHRVSANTGWDLLRRQHTRGETEKSWPNINSKHAVLWPSPHAAAAKTALTCPCFCLHIPLPKSTEFPKRQKRGQVSSTGSMHDHVAHSHGSVCVSIEQVMEKWKECCQTEKNKGFRNGKVEKKVALTA